MNISSADFESLMERLEYVEATLDKLTRISPSKTIDRIYTPREVATFLRIRNARVYAALESGALEYMSCGPGRGGKMSYLIKESVAEAWGKSIRRRN